MQVQQRKIPIGNLTVRSLSIVVLLGFYAFFSEHLYGQRPLSRESSATENSGDIRIVSEPLYYLTEDSRQRPGHSLYSIYKFNPSIFFEDELILQKARSTKIWGKFLLGRYVEDGEFLFALGHELGVLDVVNRTTKTILNIEGADSWISSAALSHDKSTIAYSIYSNDPDGIAGDGGIWLFSLETGKKKRIMRRSPLLLYAGLSVLGWSKQDTRLIVREMGGDGGDFWGQIYVVNPHEYNEYKTFDTGRKLGIRFLSGDLSPDGAKWLFSSCRPSEPEGGAAFSLPCDDGEEIIMVDFETSKEKIIYKNLSNPNNEFKGKLRLVYSYIWQDNGKIVFATPEGFYRINVDSGAIDELYLHDRGDIPDYDSLFFYLFYADEDFIAFKRSNIFDGIFIVNLLTRKVSELDQRDFYIFEQFLK